MIVFSLDLKDTYWQIPLDPDSQDKTTSLSKQWHVIPAELRNDVFVYLDDVRSLKRRVTREGSETSLRAY